jgi:hypothetical protein
MAALVTITTFSGLAPPWSLSQLDTDLQNLQTAIQSQNTFANYLTDTGAANTYVVTPAAGITGTLTAGLMLQFKAANANTGASTLNYAALGVKNILNVDGSALVANEIVANGVYLVQYDGVQFLLLNPSAKVTGGSAVWGTGIANFGTIAKRKTADQSVTSSAALVNDNDLTFAIAASEEWVADFFLDAGALLSNGGLIVAITVPGGATLNVSAGCPQCGGQGGHTISSGVALTFAAASFTGANGLVHVSVWALNGATPGSVTLQWAQATSNATPTTLRKGSHMNAVRIA